MPAWIARIQTRKDASGDIHVNLDSSTPCWNDAIEAACFKLTATPHLTKFSKRRWRYYFHDRRSAMISQEENDLLTQTGPGQSRALPTGRRLLCYRR
jgi:hypothetical protein